VGKNKQKSEVKIELIISNPPSEESLKRMAKTALRIYNEYILPYKQARGEI
jgi:hypothetical protein